MNAFAHPFAEYPMAKPTKSTKHLRRLEAQQRERLRRTEARERARAEALAIERGIDETLSLANARGEEIESTRSGAHRINDRDPILRLLRAGHLTAAQYDAGRDLRDLYDRRFEGVGSQMEMLACTTGGTSRNNDAAIFAGVQRGKALEFIASFERAVLVGWWRDRRGTLRLVEGWREMFTGGPDSVAPHLALTMARAVCGEGKSLSSEGKGRAFERNAKALAAALDVASFMRGA